MDVEAVRERVTVAAWIALALVVAGGGAWYAAVDEASRSLSGDAPAVLVVAASLLMAVGGMLGTAAAVGWVVTARR